MEPKELELWIFDRLLSKNLILDKLKNVFKNSEVKLSPHEITYPSGSRIKFLVHSYDTNHRIRGINPDEISLFCIDDTLPDALEEYSYKHKKYVKTELYYELLNRLISRKGSLYKQNVETFAENGHIKELLYRG